MLRYGPYHILLIPIIGLFIAITIPQEVLTLALQIESNEQIHLSGKSEKNEKKDQKKEKEKEEEFTFVLSTLINPESGGILALPHNDADKHSIVLSVPYPPPEIFI